MTRNASRLRSAFGSPDLAWLRDRLRRRIQSGIPLTGTVRLNHPTATQRVAIDALLGRVSNGNSIAVSLDQVDRQFRESGLCGSIEEAMRLIEGPIDNRRAAQQRLRQCWDAIFDHARQRLNGRPEYLPWLERLRSTGLLLRLSSSNPEDGQRLLANALDVLEQLPHPGVTLAVLAAKTMGDSHGLDHGQPVATLILQAVGSMATGAPEADPQTDADARRAAWESVGVIEDELSAAVLTLNLRGDAESLTDRALNLHADHGEPYRITARQLRRAKPGLTPQANGSTVYVCENPAVIAVAAQRLGPRCAPMICIDGQPKVAGRALLELLRDAGIPIAYHGDFDWGGVRIANLMMRRYGASPWRFSTSDYVAAAHDANHRLRGGPVDAVWDADLQTAMVHRDRAVFEEIVIDDLLQDLGGQP